MQLLKLCGALHNFDRQPAITLRRICLWLSQQLSDCTGVYGLSFFLQYLNTYGVLISAKSRIGFPKLDTLWKPFQNPSTIIALKGQHTLTQGKLSRT